MALSHPIESTAPLHNGRTSSQILVELADGADERVLLGEIIDALSDRGFAPLLLLFAAPNVLPLPPGSSTLFAMPLILLATQLLLAWRRAWLPRLLRDRSLDKARCKSMATRLQPYLQRFESSYGRVTGCYRKLSPSASSVWSCW